MLEDMVQIQERGQGWVCKWTTRRWGPLIKAIIMIVI